MHATQRTQRVAPAEAADLLLVARQRCDVVLLHAHVVVHDGGVARARGEHVAVPGQGAHAGRVAAHGAHLPLGRHVPQLRLRRGRADRQVRARVLDPRHGGDVVVGVGHRHELGDVAGGGVPQVQRLREGDGQHVGGAPVHDVEVVVVEQVGRVQDALGRRGDVPVAPEGARPAPRGARAVLAVQHLLQLVLEALAGQLVVFVGWSRRGLWSVIVRANGQGVVTVRSNKTKNVPAPSCGRPARGAPSCHQAGTPPGPGGTL